jgi:hypothetical protein
MILLCKIPHLYDKRMHLCYHVREKNRAKSYNLRCTLNGASLNPNMCLGPKVYSTKLSATVWQLCQKPNPTVSLLCTISDCTHLIIFVLTWFRWDQFEAAHPLAETRVIEVDEAAL